MNKTYNLEKWINLILEDKEILLPNVFPHAVMRIPGNG